MGLLRFAIKSSIAGGIVYYTIEEGLWSNANESGKIYNKLYNNITPLIQKNVPADVIKEIDHIPKLSDFKVCVVHHWNKSVKASVKFLSDLPIHISNGIDRIQKEIEKTSLPVNQVSNPVGSTK